MPSPRSLLASVLFLGLLAPAATPVAALSQPAPAWEKRLEGEAIGESYVQPAALRRIADGSTMAVFKEALGLSALRYAADGSVVSRTTMPLPYYATVVAIDAFGAVNVLALSVRFDRVYGFWTMKYDGLTGREMWPAPRRFEGSGDYAYPAAIAVANDGDVLVTGSSTIGGVGGWVTIRYERKTGAVRWGPVFFGSPGRNGTPYALAIDPSGDVLVAGTDVPPTAPGAQPGWTTVKYDGRTGALLWKSEPVGVFTYPQVCTSPCYTSYAAKVAVDSRRDVFVAVTSFDGSSQEWLTVKYEGTTGTRLWGPVDVNGPERDFAVPHDLEVDADGDLIASGHVSLRAAPWGDRAIVKYEGATGRVLWGPVLLSPFGLAGGAGFALDGFGNPIVTGSASANGTSEWRAGKFSGKSGAPLWRSNLLTVPLVQGNSSGPMALSLAGDGMVSVVGATTEGYRSEARVLAFAAANGVVRWGPVSFAGGDRRACEPVSTVADSEGNLIVVSREFDRLRFRAYGGFTAKLERTTGRTLWGPRPFSDDPDSRPVAAAVDVHDDVVVTGWVAGAAGWTTVKYDGATGDVLWGPVRYGDEHSIDVPTALTLDREGNVVVLGHTGPGGRTWALAEYDGASGTLLWGPFVYEPPLVGTSLRYSYSPLVSLDESGNVFVVAAVRTHLDRSSWATFKFDGETGSLLWGPVFLELLDTSGSPVDLAVDRDGNAVVTGRAPGASSNWATIKYSGRTGEILWGPITKEGDLGQPKDLVIDENNDVFVVGEEFRGGASRSWSTVKYDGETGAIAWGPVEGGRASFSDTPSVSLDPGGNPILLAPSQNGTDTDWMVVKYGGATGEPVWGPITYDGGQHERPLALAVAGTDFFVSGTQAHVMLTVRYTEGLAIETLRRDVAPAYCGDDFDVSLVARNGSPPYSWTLAGGSLPRGVGLLPSGLLAGQPFEEGTFAFSVRVTDASGAHAERDFALEVSEVGERPSISVRDDPVCPSGYQLSLPGSYSAYSWFPGGETSSTVAVCPENRTLYAVVATDEKGCPRRASAELGPRPGPPRAPVLRPVRPRPPAVPRSR
jgi:hypothetical protein